MSQAGLIYPGAIGVPAAADPGDGPRMDLALEFWRAFAGHEDAPITIQFFDDVKARRDARKQTEEADPFATFRHGTIRTLWPMVLQLQALGAGVFYTINPTDGRGRAKKNITAVRAAACDHDNSPPKSYALNPTLVNAGAPPSIVVSSSPGNSQTLWLLADGEPIPEWSALHKEHLIPYFRSDPPIHDLPRVLRLPGTYHLKRAPHMVTATYYDLNRRFTIAELRTAYPRRAPEPVLPKTGAPPVAPSLGTGLSDPITGQPIDIDPQAVAIFGDKRAAALTLLGTYWPEQGRHSAQLALAGGLCTELGDDAQATEALATVCRIAGDEDRTKREATIRYTRNALLEGRSIATWSMLSPAIDTRVVRRAYEWFSDTDDLIEMLRAACPAPATQVLGATTGAAWTNLLLADTKGRPLACVSNAVIAFQNHPAWSGVLSYNTRALKVILSRPPWPADLDPGKPYPRAVDDSDTTRAATWLSVVLHMPASSGVAFEAMVAIAQQHCFDPGIDFLDDDVPEWDRVPRLGTWFRDYAGAGLEDLQTAIYCGIVGTRWMVQNVARIYDPGCQADIVPILEGPQGILKSSLLRVIAHHPDLFSDQLPPVDNKDAKAHVHGPAIIEVPELAAMSKAKIEMQKAFLTMREDRFRPAYGRVEVSVLRGCSFAGTVNPGENGYLKDHTGNRRFLPILCTRIDLDGLRKVVLQLWAEAKHLYRNPDRKEVSWITREEMELYAKPQQDSRMETDALEEKIARALAEGVRKETMGLVLGADPWGIAPNTQDTSVGEIMTYVCADRGDLDPRLQTRVGKALLKMKWERYSIGVGGWRFRKPIE